MQKITATKFINMVCAADTQVTVFLANGVKLVGQVKSYEADEHGRLYSFILARSDQPQLVFANQVATVLPEDNLNLSD